MKSLLVVLISAFAVSSFAHQIGVKAATEVITESTMRIPLDAAELRTAANTMQDFINQTIRGAERRRPTNLEAGALAEKIEPNLMRQMIHTPSGARGNYLSTPTDSTIVFVNTNGHVSASTVIAKVEKLFFPSRITEGSYVGSLGEITIHGRPDDVLNALRHLNGETDVSMVKFDLDGVKLAGVKRKGVTSQLVARGSEYALSYEQAVRVVPTYNAGTTAVASQVRR